jgi:hypothetical protein
MPQVEKAPEFIEVMLDWLATTKPVELDARSLSTTRSRPAA